MANGGCVDWRIKRQWERWIFFSFSFSFLVICVLVLMVINFDGGKWFRMAHMVHDTWCWQAMASECDGA